jgi:hypothetical protein
LSRSAQLRLLRHAIVAICGLSMIPGVSAAQAGTGPRHTVLRGTTMDVLGRLVSGVTLALVEGGRETVSDSLGRFAFDSISIRRVTIAISHPGFVSLAVNLPVPEQDSMRVPLLLLSLDDTFEREVLPGVLFGVVSDAEGRPIGGVELTVLATGQVAVTDSLGRYMIRRIDPAARQIRIRKIGFAPQQMDLNEELTAATRADLMLGKLTATLETAVIREDRSLPRMRPFFTRMERDRRNQFITRGQIDLTRNGTTTDLLSRLRGVTIGQNRNGHPVPLGPMRCAIRVLLNSQEVETADVSLNAIVPLRDIAGVEAYTSRGETPSDFWFGFSGSETSSSCGVIGIWTR